MSSASRRARVGEWRHDACPDAASAVARSPRRRWIMPVAAGLAVLAIARLPGLHCETVPRLPLPLPLERVQLTFTGNATGPGISHDGTRVAYSTRQCDSTGRCTQSIVVQDVAGAGTVHRAARRAVRWVDPLDARWAASRFSRLLRSRSRWRLQHAVPRRGAPLPRLLRRPHGRWRHRARDRTCAASGHRRLGPLDHGPGWRRAGQSRRRALRQ